MKNKQKEDTGNEDEVAAKDKDNEMSDDEQHDADAMAQKVRARKDEENDYEGEEEEQRQVEEEESGALSSMFSTFHPDRSVLILSAPNALIEEKLCLYRDLLYNWTKQHSVILRKQTMYLFVDMHQLCRCGS